MAATISDQVVNNENGYTLHYCKTADNRTYIYSVPNRIDEHTRVVLYIPGTGGAYADSMYEHGSAERYLSSQINNQDNCILIVPKDPQGYANEYNAAGQLKGVVDANAVVSMVQDVLNNYDMSPDRLTANVSWSNGTVIGLKTGIYFMQQEGPNPAPRTFVLVNSAGYTPDIITDSELRTLAASNSNIIIMSESGRAPAIRKYESWANKYDINLFGINCNNYWGDSTHSMGNAMFADSNGLSALVGTARLALPSMFTFTKYNNKTHQWENMSQAEMAQLMSNMSAEQRMSLQTNYNNMINDNYSALSYINDLSLDGDGQVVSNYSFVADSMNSIREKIRQQSQELSSFDFPAVSNDNPLLCDIGIYVSNCMTILGSLMDSLTLETEAVVSYAQALVDMDNDLNSDIDKITMVPLPDDYSAIGSLKKVDDHNFDDKNNVSFGDDHPIHYKSNDGSIVTSNDFFKKATSTGEIEIGNNEKLFYSCDDGNLIELTQRITCLDQDELSRIYSELQDKYADGDMISDIVVDGFTIEVKFNKSFYDGKSLEFLIQNYFNGGN